MRKIFKWFLRFVAAVMLIIAGVLLAIFAMPLYRSYVHFPRQQAAWESLREQRQEVTLDDGWNEYRGVLHAHSFYSHDSTMPFEEILKAAKKSEVQFIFMTDHCVAGVADFSLQWEGDHDGVLFVRGFELSNGLMLWNLPDDAVVPCNAEPEEIAKRASELGGLVFWTHSEIPRQWDLPTVTGMEIYNIHTDMKDENLARLAPDLIVSMSRQPEQGMRLMFDRQTAILDNWDDINVRRDMVGYAASDSHQNVGIRGIYTLDRLLDLRSTGTDELGAYELNPVTRTLLRLFFGPLEPGKELFRLDLDPYHRSLRYVQTHVLAEACTQEALVKSLREGRAFIGFDLIADTRGFTFMARSSTGTAALGDSIALTPDLRFVAEAPLPCRFTLKRHGIEVGTAEGRSCEFVPQEPGKYRLEAELNVLGEWIPWIYTNPILVATAQN